MQTNPFRWLLPVALSMALPAAQAQQPTSATLATGAMDANASVPPLAYTSSLRAYRRLSEETLLPWREANQTVGRIGGWRAYAREASQAVAAERAPTSATLPTLPATPASAPPAAPMPAGHGGHKMH